VTGSLVRRVWQHKNKLVPGFTSRYNLTQLVYYERFFYPDAAIDREKEIKGWRRSNEDKANRIDESALGRPGQRLGQ
jgi:putative endonuclease